MRTDAEVIAALKKAKTANDWSAATRLLVEEYGKSIERLMIASLPTREHAQDLAQSIWADVHQSSFATFEFNCPPRAWLLKIARNSIAGFYDRASRRVQQHDPSDPILEALVNRFGGWQHTGESAVDLGRRSRILHNRLAKLDPDERQLLWDRYVLHMKPADIVAERGLDKSPNAVSAQLVRLGQKLKRLLGQ